MGKRGSIPGTVRGPHEGSVVDVVYRMRVGGVITVHAPDKTVAAHICRNPHLFADRNYRTKRAVIVGAGQEVIENVCIVWRDADTITDADTEA